MTTEALGSPLDARAVAASRGVLALKSKSFSLASLFLPADRRADVAVVYAFCRHVDDAIDLAPIERRPNALADLRVAIDAIYAGRATGVSAFDAFAVVARTRGIPRLYVDALVDGMAMDVARVRYETLDSLLLYAHRVAGVVGLLLCHVLGVSSDRALPNATHLGLAMQLTNICRDVAEDLVDGRIYLPRALLGIDLDLTLGRDPARDEPTRDAVSRAVRALLDEADRLYRSADLGIVALPFRSALAIRAARYVYAAIGTELRRRGGDPFLGRAVVSRSKKLWLVVRAIVETLVEQPRRIGARFPAPTRTLAFPSDVLPAIGVAP
jgi:phytoene synthase